MKKGIRFQELLPFALYFVIYLLWFQWLEERHVRSYQIIHLFVDDYIPFCEVFVIPYFLWFLYVPAAVLYAASHSREEYIRCALFLCTGMTVFLLISTFFPNIQHLRPLKMPRDNVFTHLVLLLQKVDTPTNLWPSIHVYNSVAIFCAINSCRQLQRRPGIRAGAFVLTTLIVLSTMFLKQHSICDVMAGITFSFATYILLYRAFAKMSVSVTRSPKIKARPYPVFSRNSKETAN